MSSPLMSLQSIEKSYLRGAQELKILRGVSFDIYEGESVVITGPSGAGKSTLLHIMGTLDSPTAGQVYFQEQNLFQQSDDALAKFRNQNLGFVFQFHHLLPEFTALENVLMPARLGGLEKKVAQSRALELLEHMGLLDRRDHFPSEMSGGEQQRVAVARALVMHPKILLADEPTGNLDTNNSRLIQNLFFDFKLKYNLTMLIVTHDVQFAARFPRRLNLKDGQWN
jgi:lipoprotein-releasing system ATP-binding protein